MIHAIGAFKAYRIHCNEKEIQAGFETLGIDDLSVGDVVIRAQYSSVNYKDALAATGAGRILKRFPLVGGIDVSGVVEYSENGEFFPGQRVVVTGCGLGEEVDGGYSEYVRVSADAVVALPESMSCWQAMCVGTAGFTAALAIMRLEHNGLNPDKGDVIVTGATGGVGSIAVTMLSELGYRVVALTGKPVKEGFLKRLGAHRVMLRDEIETQGKPLEKALWAGAIDNVGGETLNWLTRTTDWWGSIASIGLAGGHKLNTTVMPFILRGVNLLGINSVKTPRIQRLRVWDKIANTLTQKHFDLVGTNTLRFADLPCAFQAYLDGSVVGRQVVCIDENVRDECSDDQ